MTSDAIVQSAPEAPERLREIADQLRKGTKAEATVRQLLGFFSAQRRGYYIVQYIRNALDSLGIITEPDFESVWIDSPIEFRLRSEQAVPSSKVPAEVGEVPAVVAPSLGQSPQNGQPVLAVPEPLPVISARITDPTYRIGKLPAANQPITSVALDDAISQAVTKMMKNDYSQLPIMQGEREVKGMVSWSSIGSRLALGLPCGKVRDCNDQHREVGADTSLFDAISAIVVSGYVLVRARDNKISGIVTASDLSLQFQQLAEPFLLLGEIEQHVRKLVEGKYTQAELQDARDPADAQRPVQRVADLTLGEYIRLLENPDRWTKLKVQVDRGIFIQELDNVRRIRNDVMHFDPDPLGETDLLTLRTFVQFLQRLDEILP
jgi:CBS domain-containing protein